MRIHFDNDYLQECKQNVEEYLKPIFEYAKELNVTLELIDDEEKIEKMNNKSSNRALLKSTLVGTLVVDKYYFIGNVSISDGEYKYITDSENVEYGLNGFLSLEHMWNYICKEVYLKYTYNRIIEHFGDKVLPNFRIFRGDNMELRFVNGCKLAVKEFSFSNEELKVTYEYDDMVDKDIFEIGKCEIMIKKLESLF